MQVFIRKILWIGPISLKLGNRPGIIDRQADFTGKKAKKALLLHKNRCKIMTNELSAENRSVLLKIAREAIQSQLNGEEPLEIELEDFSPSLQEPGASFVTLTKKGLLRGCVGSIEATQALVIDVRDRAVGAAFNDYRFPTLTQSELTDVRIEISRLTPPKPLTYNSPNELTELLRPGIDGVIISFQSRRATFLPQVWKQLTTPEVFLGRLCIKMGLEGSFWKTSKMGIEIYQAEKFQEDS
jgi:AmmeMemoRadiSam system protein A